MAAMRSIRVHCHKVHPSTFVVTTIADIVMVITADTQGEWIGKPAAEYAAYLKSRGATFVDLDANPPTVVPARGVRSRQFCGRTTEHPSHGWEIETTGEVFACRGVSLQEVDL